MYHNIFVVGKQVYGESQIGYERYIEEFTDILANTTNNISITGLNRFGKSSIVKEVKERVKGLQASSTIILYVDLGKQKNYGHFLESIYTSFMEETWECDKLLSHPVFMNLSKRLEETDSNSMTYRDWLQALFKIAKKLGYKVILMVDEFDAASDKFADTADFEYLRDLSTDRDTSVSLCLASRRQLYMIEKKNFNNSTFHGIVNTHPIDGFNDEDLEKYYRVFSEKYGIEINDFSKERLDYYCGRSPYLLSMFGYDIVECFTKQGEFNIDDIYQKRQIDITNYYKSVQACLSFDKINVYGAVEETSSIEKLVGIIIGPKLDIIENDIKVLESMGCLSNSGGRYYSVSGYFTNYLRNIPLKVDTWKYIINLEKKLKSMIRHRFNAKNNTEYLDYDWWTKVFVEIGASAQMEIYDRFIASSMREYKCNVDMLDVCSLDICVSMLKCYWEDDFSQFFNKDNWEEWSEKLELCASARNPMAHGHERFIYECRNVVNEYCQQIVTTITDNKACLSEQFKLQLEENIKKYNLREQYYNKIYSNVNQGLVGVQAEFVACEQCTKGIKGYVACNDKFYSCTVGTKKWADKYNVSKLSGFLGNTYRIVVSDVNLGQNSIQVNLL